MFIEVNISIPNGNANQTENKQWSIGNEIEEIECKFRGWNKIRHEQILFGKHTIYMQDFFNVRNRK